MSTCFKTTILFLLVAAANAAAFQGGERPAPVPPTGAATKSTRPRIPVRTRSRSTVSDAPKLATLTITVSPTDSAVWLNDQRVTEVTSDGRISLANLKPGPYVLTVRHDGYSEQAKSVGLSAGTNQSLSIILVRLKGTLVVRPNV